MSVSQNLQNLHNSQDHHDHPHRYQWILKLHVSHIYSGNDSCLYQSC